MEKGMLSRSIEEYADKTGYYIKEFNLEVGENTYETRLKAPNGMILYIRNIPKIARWDPGLYKVELKYLKEGYGLKRLSRDGMWFVIVTEEALKTLMDEAKKKTPIYQEAKESWFKENEKITLQDEVLY